MKCHRDRSTTSRIIHWQMSQGQVIDIMTFNSYSLQFYSFWKGKIGFGFLKHEDRFLCMLQGSVNVIPRLSAVNVINPKRYSITI